MGILVETLWLLWEAGLGIVLWDLNGHRGYLVKMITELVLSGLSCIIMKGMGLSEA